MPDANHIWGNDIALSPSGDIALVDGDALTTQRIIRRLMTAVKGYIWHLEYGAGIPQRIGDVLDVGALTGIVTNQIALETTVAKAPAPVISLRPILNGIAVSILYASAITGAQTTLAFDATN